MSLKIISGLARGIMLDTPDGRSMRPTSGRAREALFSSLGSLEGVRFADIFAGSGAIGLEAASRGAAAVALLEGDFRHVKFIERNTAKLRKAGVQTPIQLVSGKLSPGALLRIGACDIWFFDPPYAESADFLAELIKHRNVLELFRNSLVIWEMPDTAEARGKFQAIAGLDDVLECRIKSLGGNDFMLCKVRDLEA